MNLLLSIVVGMQVAATSIQQPVAFTTDDTHLAIEMAARDHGVSARLLDCMAFREATYRPYAIGSRGEQGVAQLKSPGRRDDFYARGYTDPFDPFQALDYQAISILEGAGPAWAAYYPCGGGR